MWVWCGWSGLGCQKRFFVKYIYILHITQYKELHEDIIRNDSIRHTSVQSKTNTKTDSSRIENSRDDDRGITGFFKDGNQYKELHEDTVISFPFYEITFDILL